MFFLALCAEVARAATGPIGLDGSLIAWQWCKHSYAGEDAYRDSFLGGLQTRGATAIVYPLQDSRDGWNLWLGGNVVLGMYMLGTPSPVDGHRTDDWVKRCNSVGVTTQIPVLFNVQDSFAGEFGLHEDYLRWFANSINWAPAGQFIVCLGLYIDRNQQISSAWTPDYLNQMAGKLKQYTGGRFKIAIHAAAPQCLTWGAGSNIDIIYTDPSATVTVQASPAAGGTVAGGGTYLVGTQRQISAQANNGWVFTGWNDGVANNPRTIVVGAGAATYTANFAPATTLTLQANPANGGNMIGGGLRPVGVPITIIAQPTMGWRFLNWSDGNTNRFRTITLGAAGGNLTANFMVAPMSILLQAGDGGMGGRWTLGADYLPATWTQITGAMGDGWVLRAINQNRILLQQGVGGAINIWELTNGVPSKMWNVSAAIPAWIARDFDGNRVLLQAGDGGMVGIWTLSVSNTPAAWSAIADPTTGLIARALRDNRILVQFNTSTTIGFWTLNSANRVTAWTPINAALPAGWILRSMTPDYMLLQAGDGGMAGIWDLDATGQPMAWHELTQALPGWIIRSMDHALPATLTVVGSTNIGGSVTGGGMLYVGANATITATASNGWVFARWNDGVINNPRMVVVPAGGATYTALFSKIVTISALASPTNAGYAGGSGSYASDTLAQLSATASNGWAFTQWNDGNTNAVRSVPVPMTNITYTANFAPTAVIGTSVNTNVGGRVTGSGTFIIGSSQVLTAVASNGWIFTSWSDGSTNNPRTVIVTTGGATYTANFTPTAMLALQASPANAGNVSGGGLRAVGFAASIGTRPTMGWRFLNWSDGDTNRVRSIVLGAAGTNLTANFAAAPTAVLLQAGNGGMAGIWTLGTNYLPATWSPVTGALGGGWVLRAINQHRVLLQQGTGGMIGLWELNSSGAPTNWWLVSGVLPGWIARDLDGNRVLLQAGDGGMVGCWTLGTNNTPATWNALAATLSPGLIARALCGNKVLVQAGTIGSYWTLDGSNNVSAVTAISAVLPAGWILRSMTPDYMLLQAGDGGMAGIWDLDANGNPIDWHTITGPLSGWILRGMNQP
ncbi:MAG: hypothetical protein EPN23_00870 [Verrucomicrobia bacterium]|nr:MAG: hypothetical protein EPN23_00870 [Verrucomicrobiota bacterium]